ncbi:MAG: acyltransferase [Magnetococcales bacterium]|nr:acyltransferase [Magnetococcales bacterium]
MTYRREIDGLRAIAVLSVILFHIKIVFKGGFLGVDIFFVISGYLITSLILQELKETNGFSFANFYERRARRILPILTLVSLVSMPFAWQIMDGDQLQSFGQALLSIAGFVSNVYFWLSSGYFAAPADLLPMLHTWSLSIEEQFYLLFPLFVILVWKFRPHLLLSLSALMIMGSLQLAEWSSQRHLAPDAAFYLLPTRAWELLIGVFLAAAEQETGRLSNRLLDAFMPALGMLLILNALVFYDKTLPHPSFSTLPVVLGTALLIWFCKPGEIVSDILSSTYFVGLGLISYSMYLWHVPILVFSRLFNIGKLPEWIPMGLIPILIPLSALSWKYIERPFRDRNRINRWWLITILASTWTAILLIGFLFSHFKGFPHRMQFPEPLEQSFHFRKELSQCMKSFSKIDPSDEFLCEIGSRKQGPIDFMLIGDSHALAAAGGFQHFAEANQMRAIAVFQGACPHLLGIERGNCHILYRRLLQFTAENPVKVVFMVSNWGFLYLPAVDAQSGVAHKSTSELNSLIKKAFHFTVDEYNKVGSKVVILGQVPMQNYKAREIYKRIYSFPESMRAPMLEKMHLTRTEHLQNQNSSIIHGLFGGHQANGYLYLDPTNHFCDNQICPVGTVEKSRYYDHDHISDAGSVHIERLLRDYQDMIFN